MKNTNKLGYLMLAGMLASCASAAQPCKMAPVLQPYVDSRTLAGAVMLVADPSNVLALEAVGWMDLAAKKEMRTDCVFWIASQTKPITAAALMILADEGKLSVDDPVEKYVPEFKDLWVAEKSDKDQMLLKRPRHPILVREILSHTSGLPFRSALEQPTLDLYPLELRVRSYSMAPLSFEPGLKAQYSNAGINTAGRIVEIVSGMPFETFLDERLFKPLGMKDTGFWPSKSQLKRLAKAYRPNAAKGGLEECLIEQLKYPLSDRIRQPMPAGGLFSTATDLSVFYRMLANNGTFSGKRILSEKSVRQMTSDQSGEARSSYGFGFSVAGNTFGHGGAYSTHSRYDRDHQLITIFLVQHAGWAQDGKMILPAFQNAATDLFGSRPASAATEAKPGTITNSVGMRLVRIEPGTFTMGQSGPPSDYKLYKNPNRFDDADWDERPAHRVTVTQPYYMGATEVTLGQYRKFLTTFRGTEGDGEAAVNGISWDQAVAFCEWLSGKEGRPYRLPTEAEWEYACRAGTATLFSTGDALPPQSQAWYGDSEFRARYFKDGKMSAEYRVEEGRPVLRVAQTPANAWGLYDMHGNVAEWCLDWYGPYEAGDQSDPLGRSAGDFRVFRGGRHSTFTRLSRSANRAAWLPQTKNDKVGFRVVIGELPRGKALPPAPPPLNAQNVRQVAAKSAVQQKAAPHFSGPEPYVKIPTDSAGPLFSTHNHSPSLTECPNGDLLAVWYSCVDENGSELCNVASRLRLGSAEWEPASPFWDGADVNDHAPKVWWDGGQTLFNFARGRDENLVRTSADNGATWSKAVLIQPAGEFGNQPLRLRDGTLVLGNDSRQCSLVFSLDRGKSWDFNDVKKRESDFRPGGRGFRYPGIHAPMVQLADGRILAMSRNDDPEDQQKFNFKTPASTSGDLGKTWTYEASEFPAISSVQRAAMLRLSEGPILFCSFTDQWRDWKSRKGLTFKAAGGTEFTGYGLFAALSYDEGKTWPVRKLITPGGQPRSVNGIDRLEFELGDTMAEPCGYLAATQTRDGRVQLISSKNHYVFNLAWLEALPAAPQKQ